MFLYLSVSFLLSAAGLLMVAALRPDQFTVARSITIAAPARFAFGQVNSLQRWQEMSPYVKLDPAARYIFAGPEAGVGASLAWVGNQRLGEGRLTITESQPEELVRMRLQYVRPFACDNLVAFTFRADARRTVVTWSMTGKYNFVARVMGLFGNMDRIVGPAFEEGLATMKTRAEAAAAG